MGQSTFCGKCSKIIKKAAFEQVHVLCDECYQLFLIKDPIFYEAKVIKEKEINRQWRRRFALQLAISLLIPGFYLNFREKTKLFVFLSGLFFLLGGYFVFTSLLFHRYFGTVPLFLNLMGMATFFWYLLVNIYAVSGDENGF